jgi:hypothetical protein
MDPFGELKALVDTFDFWPEEFYDQNEIWSAQPDLCLNTGSIKLERSRGRGLISSLGVG